MSVRWKILSGFLILALMLAAGGLWSVHALRAIGSSVRGILDDNYRSVEAAHRMTEALERQDSGVLLLLEGQWEVGRTMIAAADSSFRQNLNVAKSNLTVAGEGDLVDRVIEAYARYEALRAPPIVDTPREGNLDWYFQEVHPVFLAAKEAVERVAELNDQSMYETASELKDRSRRAAMPGVIAVLSALAFVALFNLLVNLHVVHPLTRITEGVRAFEESSRPYEVEINTNDELAELSISIRSLCAASSRRRSSS
jgi:HAMP domain-containing protein